MAVLSEVLAADESMECEDPQHILARHFRKLCNERQMTIEKWSNHMDWFIEQVQHEGMSEAAKTAIRANLARELMDLTMTWKTFLKGLAFLRVSLLQVTFTALAQDDLEENPLIRSTTATRGLTFDKLI